MGVIGKVLEHTLYVIFGDDPNRVVTRIGHTATVPLLGSAVVQRSSEDFADAFAVFNLDDLSKAIAESFQKGIDPGVRVGVHSLFVNGHKKELWVYFQLTRVDKEKKK